MCLNLTTPHINVKDLSGIIRLIYLNKHNEVIKKFSSLCNIPYDQFLSSVKFCGINNIYNPLSRFVFIISDLNEMLNNLKGETYDGGKLIFGGGRLLTPGPPSYVGWGSRCRGGGGG